jgi:hypothetical protein
MTKTKIFGVFDDEDKLISSLKKLKEKDIKISDVISPYPVEEVFHILKMKTRLPIAAFFYGLFGLLATFTFLYWTSVISYPLVYGGKPQNTLSFVIVIFVMVIFVTILFTLVSFFLREKKGPGAKPKVEYPGITDDKFLVIIDKSEGMDTKGINDIFKAGGAIEITEQE